MIGETIKKLEDFYYLGSESEKIRDILESFIDLIENKSNCCNANNKDEYRELTEYYKIELIKFIANF